MIQRFLQSKVSKLGGSHPSIRTRILVGIFCSFVLITGVAAGFGYGLALHETDEIFDARLATSARVLDSLLNDSLDTFLLEKPIVIALPGELSTEGVEESTKGHPYETKLAFQVWSFDGKLLVKSASAPDTRLGIETPGFLSRTVENKQWHVFALKSDDHWIELAEVVGLRAEIAEDIAFVLTSPLVLAALLLTLLVHVIVISSFRPIDRITDAIEGRGPQELQPVNTQGSPAEVFPLVDALNRLLSRVEQAFSRERRFNDSAAHELRTPLAALSLHTNNAAAARTDEERAESLAKLNLGLTRTKALVEQMLMYGRISSGQDGEKPVKCSLTDMIKEVVSVQQEMLEGTSIKIALRLPEKTIPTILAKQHLLEIALRNVLENACKYNAKPEQAIEFDCSMIEAESCVLIRVRNACRPIAPAEVARLLEPYYRGEGAYGKGHGLGLAIVKEVVDHHDQWVMSVNVENDTFCVSIKVPSQTSL